MHASLAALLAIECALTRETLRTAGAETLLGAIDREASAARIHVGLGDPTRAYLRALDGADNIQQEGPMTQVRLPMRLTDRIAGREIAPLLDAAELDRAVSWERAATLAGRTMGEWAALAALRGAEL